MLMLDFTYANLNFHTNDELQMNKYSYLITLFFISFAAGCQKNDENITQQQNKLNAQHQDNKTTQNFQRVDAKITQFLDQIEDPKLNPQLRKQIICQDFSKVYTQEYIPALLVLNAETTSEKQLLDEMNFSLNYYQEIFKIKCKEKA